MRVMICVQPIALVTVLTTVMVTLVPQQSSTALGASKLQGVPHGTLLFVAPSGWSGCKWRYCRSNRLLARCG